MDTLSPATFIDVGANIGFYSLLVASKGVSVIAIEASPHVLPALEQSISLNPALSSRIRLIHAAASDVGGESTFWVNEVEHNFGLGSTVGPHPETKPSALKAINVRCVKLDDAISPEITKPVLCKIDVEGSEFRVLRGMTELIRTLQPVFIIEVHPNELLAAGSSAHQLLSLLWDCQYLTEDFGAAGKAITSLTPLLNDNFWVLARPRQ